MPAVCTAWVCISVPSLAAIAARAAVTKLCASLWTRAGMLAAKSLIFAWLATRYATALIAGVAALPRPAKMAASSLQNLEPFPGGEIYWYSGVPSPCTPQ